MPAVAAAPPLRRPLARTIAIASTTTATPAATLTTRDAPAPPTVCAPIQSARYHTGPCVDTSPWNGRAPCSSAIDTALKTPSSYWIGAWR
jgi:hypothetical protein